MKQGSLFLYFHQCAGWQSFAISRWTVWNECMVVKVWECRKVVKDFDAVLDIDLLCGDEQRVVQASCERPSHRAFVCLKL